MEAVLPVELLLSQVLPVELTRRRPSPKHAAPAGSARPCRGDAQRSTMPLLRAPPDLCRLRTRAPTMPLRASRPTMPRCGLRPTMPPLRAPPDHAALRAPPDHAALRAPPDHAALRAPPDHAALRAPPDHAASSARYWGLSSPVQPAQITERAVSKQGVN